MSLPTEKAWINTNFKLLKSLISLSLKHDLDEVAAAKTSAGNSYRNPVEMCPCIANLGLQSVGLMRTTQDPNFERLMNKCDGNSDVRKECKMNAIFKAGFMKSLCEPGELLESVLLNFPLKGIPFSIFSPGTEEDEDALEKELDQIDERF